MGGGHRGQFALKLPMGVPTADTMYTVFDMSLMFNVGFQN